MAALRRVTCLLIAILAGVALAQTEYEGLRDEALQRLGRQLHDGEQEQARRDLAHYLDRYPGDAVMQYNLACLLAVDGRPDSALVHLGRAFEAGYRDLERARRDPDLATLQDDPRLDELIAATRERLVAEMLAAEIQLEEGVWSEPRPLAPAPHAPGPGAAAGRLRARYDVDGLELEITTPPGGADEAIVLVALPQSLEDFETRRWFEFRAPLLGETTVARTGRNGRADPAPAAGHAVPAAEGAWSLRLPWSSVHPFRPPVELLLGLDVTLRRETETAPAARWALVRDPHAASTLVPWRRFAPLALDPGPTPAPALAGRLETYLVVGDSLSVELGIQGLPEGEATVVQTVGGEPDTTFTTHLDPELAYLTLFYRLPAERSAGWFELGAEVGPAAGPALVWRDRGFRLHPDWFVEQRERLATLPEVERTIVQYELVKTLRGQQSFQPQDDPSRLAEAALRAEALLDRAAESGTVLPPRGGHLEGAFPLGDDALQSCQLVLPPRDRRGDGALLVVVVPSSELAGATAAALADGRAPDDPRSFLVTSVPAVPGRPDLSVNTIRQAADWGLALAATPALRLVSTGKVRPYVTQAAATFGEEPVPLLLLDAELSAPPPAHVTLGGSTGGEPSGWAAAVLDWR